MESLKSHFKDHQDEFPNIKNPAHFELFAINFWKAPITRLNGQPNFIEKRGSKVGFNRDRVYRLDTRTGVISSMSISLKKEGPVVTVHTIFKPRNKKLPEAQRKAAFVYMENQ